MLTITRRRPRVKAYDFSFPFGFKHIGQFDSRASRELRRVELLRTSLLADHAPDLHLGAFSHTNLDIDPHLAPLAW